MMRLEKEEDDVEEEERRGHDDEFAMALALSFLWNGWKTRPPDWRVASARECGFWGRDGFGYDDAAVLASNRGARELDDDDDEE